MFKEEVYDKIITVLNLDSAVFKGGYLIGLYQDGIPYVVDSSTVNKFAYEQEEVIPVSEEIANETPSVNLADRSDYYFQYQILFRTTRQAEVKSALEAFRAYFLLTKQHTIDGYTVAFKTSRGDKQGTVPVQSGNFYSLYKINVYVTAIKNGYIKKDADTWKMKISTQGTYDTLILARDVMATSGNPIFNNATEVGKGFLTTTTLNSKLQIFYDNTTTDNLIYKWIMNKQDKDTLFNMQHVFNGVTYSWSAYIVGGARTLLPNEVVILEFDWIEADV
jgi:hypothetical protein